jgi:hypothetical protein
METRVPKPTTIQREAVNGYSSNSIMARLSAEEKRALKAKMAKAARDGSAFERTIRWGSEPRHG